MNTKCHTKRGTNERFVQEHTQGVAAGPYRHRLCEWAVGRWERGELTMCEWPAGRSDRVARGSSVWPRGHCAAAAAARLSSQHRGRCERPPPPR
eukprot:3330321-Pyramimonas_sp.AAC.1